MVCVRSMDWEDFLKGDNVAKKTTYGKLDVTGMNIGQVGLASAKKISEIREAGWHYSGAFPVDWLLEDGVPKNYIIFIFAK